jgi:hypothetical protein
VASIVESKGAVDEYGRAWRLAPSGVEHIERPSGSDRGSIFNRAAGQIVAYCGREIGELPDSETAGRVRPCVSCLRAEFSDDE